MSNDRDDLTWNQKASFCRALNTSGLISSGGHLSQPILEKGEAAVQMLREMGWSIEPPPPKYFVSKTPDPPGWAIRERRESGDREVAWFHQMLPGSSRSVAQSLADEWNEEGLR